MQQEKNSKITRLALGHGEQRAALALLAAYRQNEDDEGPFPTARGSLRRPGWAAGHPIRGWLHAGKPTPSSHLSTPHAGRAPVR